MPEGDEEIDEETMEELQAIIEADYEVRAAYGMVPYAPHMRTALRAQLRTHVTKQLNGRVLWRLWKIVTARQSWLGGAGDRVGDAWVPTAWNKVGEGCCWCTYRPCGCRRGWGHTSLLFQATVLRHQCGVLICTSSTLER